MNKKILIIFIMLLSLLIVNAEKVDVEWTIQSVQGTGDKCSEMNAGMSGYTVTDYAAIFQMSGITQITTCGSKKVTVIMETKPFKFSSDIGTLEMHLPSISGAKYEIGIDGSNFELLEEQWFEDIATNDCVNDLKSTGDMINFDSYKIAMDKFNDSNSHVLTMRAVKSDVDCPISYSLKNELNGGSSLGGGVDVGGIIDSVIKKDVILECPKGYEKTKKNGVEYCKYDKCSIQKKVMVYVDAGEKSLYENKKAGVITSKTGRVLIERGIEIIPGVAGTILNYADTIVAEEGAEAVINLDDRGTFLVTEKTKFQLQIPQKEIEQSSISVFFQTLWCRLKSVTKGEVFDIKVPAGGGGVRG